MKVKAETFASKAKVITINVNGYRARKEQIKRFILEQGPNCVVALNDTRLAKHSIVEDVPGYTLIRSDKDSHNMMATAGGVAFFVPKKWSCLKVELKTSADHFDML